MMYELMAAAANIPATGDNFPVKTFVIIAVIAVIAAVVMGVLTKGRNNDDDDADENEPGDQNNSQK